MVLITVIIILALMACNSTRQPQKRITSAACKTDPRIKQLQAEMRLRQQERREQERQWKQAERNRIQKEKAAAQAEKLRQRKEQAAADEVFYQSQLNTVIELLTDVEKAINHLDFEIDTDKKTRSLDRMQFHQRQKEGLIKKQMQYENKIHVLESKIAKCYYIINS